VAIVAKWELEEGSGTTVVDSSGNGHTGTISGDPTWVTGVGSTGVALRMDGTGDYITIPHNAAFNGTTALSVSVWAKPEVLATQYLVKKASGTSPFADGWEVGLSSSGPIFWRFNAEVSGNTYRIQSTASYPTGGSTWVHICGTWDGTTMRLYVNGTEAATAITGPAGGPVTNTLAVKISGENAGYRVFTGAMDRVAIYNHALSSAEVAALAVATPATGFSGTATSTSTATLTASGVVELSTGATLASVAVLTASRVSDLPPSGNVQATNETAPFTEGTTPDADDPAIWYNAASPADSLVLGTNKASPGGGIGVWTLDGTRIQYLPVGKMNNVDLRDGVFSGRVLVISSNRTTNAISFFWLDRTTRVLSTAGEATVGFEPYGCALYVSAVDGKVYAFITENTPTDGAFRQYELTESGGVVSGTLVRSLTTTSLSEGLVADDATGKIFLSHEDVGFYVYGAEPGDGSSRTTIDTVGAGNLVADVEGCAIAYGLNGAPSYVLVSSQGNSTFHVYDLASPHNWRKTFSVTDGTHDAVTDCDGLDVTRQNLGPLYPNGLIVVQDGSDTGGTDFKFIDAGAVLGYLGNASISETATITAAGAVGAVGKVSGAATPGTATLTSLGFVGKVTTVGIAAAVAIAASGVVAVVAPASITETSTITASGVVGRAASATLTPTATLTAAGVVELTTGAALNTAATITATGSVTAGMSGTSALSASNALTATGAVGRSSASSVAASASLAASGAVLAGVSSPAALATVGALTASGQVGKMAGSTLSAVAAIVATGTVARSSMADLSSTADIVAVGAVHGAYAPAAVMVRAVLARSHNRPVLERSRVHPVPARTHRRLP